MRRIGVLLAGAEDDQELRTRVAVFEQGLAKLGWTGANLQIHYRWAGIDQERLRAYAAELVSMNPDAILAQNALTLVPLQRATGTIPIVFTTVYDPVGSGFVTSLARPDGNITGFTLGEFTLGGKMAELLKGMVPEIRHVAVMLNRDQPPLIAMWRTVAAIAPALGVRLTAVNVRAGEDIEAAIETAAREPNGGLVVLPSAITLVHRAQVIALAARYRVPAVYGLRYFAASGGLVSYGTDIVEAYRRAPSYIDRILKGAKPADLPVQQPTKFELVVNLKTAKTLGLEIPPKLLALADEVIE